MHGWRHRPLARRLIGIALAAMLFTQVAAAWHAVAHAAGHGHPVAHAAGHGHPVAHAAGHGHPVAHAAGHDHTTAPGQHSATAAAAHGALPEHADGWAALAGESLCQWLDHLLLDQAPSPNARPAASPAPLADAQATREPRPALGTTGWAVQARAPPRPATRMG